MGFGDTADAPKNAVIKTRLETYGDGKLIIELNSPVTIPWWVIPGTNLSYILKSYTTKELLDELQRRYSSQGY
jgi:hypothetical protein